MNCKRFFSLLVLVFGLFGQPGFSFGQAEGNTAEVAPEGAEGPKKEGINITELVFGHVSDSHEWHFFSTKKENGEESPVAVPLPMIIYQPGTGLKIFSSHHFEEWHHGAEGSLVSNSYEGLHIEKKIKEKVVAEGG